jgi:hypothetical protein
MRTKRNLIPTTLLCALLLEAATGAAQTVSFSSSTASLGNSDYGPDGLAMADVNGDGKLDLICANYGFRWAAPGEPGGWSTALTVLTNDGSGGFGINAALTVGQGPTSVVAADVNGDGKPDLITANETDNTLTVLTNNGSGLFGWQATPATGSRPHGLVAMDVNGDGKQDLCFVNSGANTVMVLTNNGSGGLGIHATNTVGSQPLSLTALDVNGDGKPDLVTANKNDDSLTVLTNEGSGGFGFSATLLVGHNPDGVAAADVNNDGEPDLISVNWGGNTMTVLTNNGSGGFGFNATLSVGSYPSSVAAADVNGDGWLDLICANSGDNNLTVLTNNRSGGFGFNTTLGTGRIPNVWAADFNGDGKPDLACPNFQDGTVTVLLNTTVFSPQTDLLSSFDSDADGWVGIDVQGPPYDIVTHGPYALNWFATGGDPDGRVGTTDTSPILFCFSAPANYLGNHLGWYGGSLRYELRFQNDGLAPGFVHPDVILTGGGLALVADAGTDPLAQTDTWLPFGVTFVEGNWHLNTLDGPNPTASQLKMVLSNVTAIYIRGDFFSGLDSAWLDNVAATGSSPQLQIAVNDSGVMLQWPASVNTFTLQTTQDLRDTNSWTAVTIVPTPVGTNQQVILNRPTVNTFFRLKQ